MVSKLMEDIVELSITDKQIATAFLGYNFGKDGDTEYGRRHRVAQAILEQVCGYDTGRSMNNILVELGLKKSIEGMPVKAAKRWMYSQYHY